MTLRVLLSDGKLTETFVISGRDLTQAAQRARIVASRDYPGFKIVNWNKVDNPKG